MSIIYAYDPNMDLEIKGAIYNINPIYYVLRNTFKDSPKS